ncbi:MAG: hypothetical protein WCJ62_01660 [Flavobacterium sp.]
MKKVFLSLAVIAALSVVSCKQSENKDGEKKDSVAVEAPAAPVADTTKPAADTTKAAAPAADAAKPAADAAKPAAPAKK